MAQRRKIAHKRALYKAYSGEPAWKAEFDRLKRPYYMYMSRFRQDCKIRNSKQRKHIGKSSFVIRNIRILNKLPMNALRNFPSKPSNFRQKVRKVISKVKCGEVT